MNHEKQVVYWRESAEEDWEVGRSLVQQDKTRHGLFFVHLALEKILKAHVSRVTEDIPPKIHNLMRLVEIGRVSLTDEQKDALAGLNQYNLLGRYPHTLGPEPSRKEAVELLVVAEGIYRCLVSQL
jgi:HEPN domain-containing protein